MAQAVFELMIRIPLLNRNLAIEKESHEETLRQSLIIGETYRVNIIKVNYREKEIDITLGIQADVHTCEELEKPRAELIKEAKEKIIPGLLCYLYYKHGLAFPNPHSDIELSPILKECNSDKSVAGRVFKFESKISLSFSAEIEISSAFNAYDLAKFVEKSLRDVKQEEADKLARIITWYERGRAENDYIDKFMYYWIAVEAWASYYAEKQGLKNLGVGKKLRKAYENTPVCMNIPGEKTPTGGKTVYIVRCKLFHFGIQKDVEEAIPELEKCLKQYIIPKVKESIENLLS